LKTQASCGHGCTTEALDPKRAQCDAHGALYVRDADRGHERAPLLGHTLDERFHLVGVLGAESFGTAYLGVQSDVARFVSVKVLSDRGEQTATRRRFREEANTLARLNSDNIVRVHYAGSGFPRHPGDPGTDTGPRVLYLVSKAIKGPTLRQALRLSGAMQPTLALAIGRQILDALAVAHAEGVIHRDLKPSKVMLVRGKRGRPKVKVLDFGIAKILGGDGNATIDGKLLGTARYMAPEQLEGAPLTPAADLFSVAVMLYELIEGRPLYDAPTAQALWAARIAPGEPALPEHWPSALTAVIRRALLRDPSKRFARAEAFSTALTALEKVLGTAPKKAPRQTRVVRAIDTAPPRAIEPSAEFRAPPRAVRPGSTHPDPTLPDPTLPDPTRPEPKRPKATLPNTRSADALVDESGPIEPSTDEFVPPFRPAAATRDPFAQSLRPPAVAPPVVPPMVDAARSKTRPLPDAEKEAILARGRNRRRTRPLNMPMVFERGPDTPLVRPSLLVLLACVTFGWILGSWNSSKDDEAAIRRYVNAQTPVSVGVPTPKVQPVPDAALPDAALPDAALPDAALPDAALPDAAVPDAALPDAAPTADAAAPDAEFELPIVHVPGNPCGRARADYRASLADTSGLGLRGQRETLAACAKCVGEDTADPCALEYNRLQRCVSAGVRIEQRAKRATRSDAKDLARKANRCRFWCKGDPPADDHWDLTCEQIERCAEAVHARAASCKKTCRGAPRALAKQCL
jgi:serine/threonine protein kinase